MDFVAIDTHIGSDRVTFAISSGANISRIEAVGHLTLLYASLALHAEDGDLSSIPDDLLETWAGWTKRRGVLAPIIRAQLCDAQGVVRAWDRWNGAMIRKAKADRERKRAARANGPSVDSPRKVHGQSAPVPRNGARTVPDLTVPDHTTTTTTRDFVPPKSPKGGWPARVAEVWTRRIGVVPEGRVGKALQPFVRLYPSVEAAIPALTRAVEIYAETCTRRGQTARWEDFVRGVQGYVPATLQPPERAA